MTGNVTISFKNLITMLDGKAIKAIMEDNSPSVCKICIPQTRPKEMNKIDLINNKKINITYFEFGISLLNLWINTFDCMLHVAYRMKLKCWTVRGEDNKDFMLNENKRVQQELKEQLGLRVDYPVPGSGFSNSGNTAIIFLIIWR